MIILRFIFVFAIIDFFAMVLKAFKRKNNPNVYENSEVEHIKFSLILDAVIVICFVWLNVILGGVIL